MNIALPRPRSAMRRRRTTAALLAGALALAGCGGGTSEQANDITVAPATTIPSAPVVQAISGNQVDFADVLTQDTVLWFWAPW